MEFPRAFEERVETKISGIWGEKVGDGEGGGGRGGVNDFYAIFFLD